MSVLGASCRGCCVLLGGMSADRLVAGRRSGMVVVGGSLVSKVSLLTAERNS